MKNKYPLWIYSLLGVMLLFGIIYAIPNIYGDDPALQISSATAKVKVDAKVEDKIKLALQKSDIKIKEHGMEEEGLLFRFFNTTDQLLARDIVEEILGEDYTLALNLAAATPAWLEAIGAKPMKLGLDLRGGVNFLLEVDINSVISRRMDGLQKSIAKSLRKEKIRYSGLARKKESTLLIYFRDSVLRDSAYNLLRRDFADLLLSKENGSGRYRIIANLSPAALQDIRQYTIEQTMTTLRNRVNELGVAEAKVQQRGSTRVAVDLPGIQDSTRAKRILGGTATLEFHMVDLEHDPSSITTGLAPAGTRFYEYSGRPYLLKNQVILSGDSIVNARSGFDETGRPNVSIQLGGGENLFSQVTRSNIGKPMAIVFVETKLDTKIVNDEEVKTRSKNERIISVANIQSALGINFQITGLTDSKEARDLSLFLRAGSLPAAVDIVEERLIGPSLGMENIKRGIISLEVGLGVVLLLMMIYYRTFGVFANIALVINLILLVAILSIMGATLTLPGIAGIVLTIGMAVDANVLIDERIREELRHGLSVQAAIYAGYERALSTIIDANVTTLIVAIVLLAIGTGPVQGFAVTLTVGLLTSMITGVMYTRAMVNFVYGGKALTDLSIGIKV